MSSVFVCILLYYLFFFVESLFNKRFISLTFFQKLQPGKDCTSDSANLFQVSDYYVGGGVFVRLRSQRPGLKPTKRAYLAATVDTQPTPLVSGKLLLVEKHDYYQRNKLKIRLVY